jgi:hypothetical protein
MHHVTRRSHRMQKHKFGVTCPGVLFIETALGLPQHEKWCIDVSCPVRTGMHYVTHKSHWMQKHKLSVTCPHVLFMETTPGPPDHEK